MSETKPTAGPWRAMQGVEDDETRWGVVTSDGEFLVAVIDNGAPGDTLATEAANARVMAASRELLDAAKAVRETCPADPDINPRWNAAWDALLAAIAKAEG